MDLFLNTVYLESLSVEVTETCLSGTEFSRPVFLLSCVEMLEILCDIGTELSEIHLTRTSGIDVDNYEDLVEICKKDSIVLHLAITLDSRIILQDYVNGESYDIDGKFLVYGEYIIIDQWSTNYYTIQWLVEDYLVYSEQVYGEEIVFPEKPIRYGYTFDGWVSEEGVPVSEGDSYSVEEDTIYTATWKVNGYSIYWVIYGELIETEQEFGADIIFPEEPEKETYDFGGWWTKEEGGLPLTLGDTYQIAEDSFIYAQCVQVFSVTVPVVMPVYVNGFEDVETIPVYIENNSTGAVKVESSSLRCLNGWSVVPFAFNVKECKVDSKLVGFRINEFYTTKFGTEEVFIVEEGWVLQESESMEISYDAVVSPISEDCANENFLDVVFVVSWYIKE